LILLTIFLQWIIPIIKMLLHLAKTDEDKNKVKLILNELFPNENVDVPDPYYGLQNGFDSVYEMLDEACDILAKKLIQKHS
jgi:protein-tyrosine phosphatase